MNLVNGGREVVEAICDHPGIRAVSFVGSTPVARSSSTSARRTPASASRPSAAPRTSSSSCPTPISIAAFPRSRSPSTAAPASAAWPGACCCPSAPAHDEARDRLVESARALQDRRRRSTRRDDGAGDQPQHRERVLSYVDQGVSRRRGARARRTTDAACRPAERLLRRPDRVRRRRRRPWRLAVTRSSDPSRSVCRVADLDDAFRVMDAHPNANATSIFTSSGKTAREFAHRATASMVGVNIGVAAPMAYFPFGGARDSFFGDLKVHGRDAFDVLHGPEGHDFAGGSETTWTTRRDRRARQEAHDLRVVRAGRGRSDPGRAREGRVLLDARRQALPRLQQPADVREHRPRRPARREGDRRIRRPRCRYAMPVHGDRAARAAGREARASSARATSTCSSSRTAAPKPTRTR